MSDSIIFENNLSFAWMKIFHKILNSPGKEIYSQIVSVDLNDGLNEEWSIKEILNQELDILGVNKIETVASTIFPKSLWNPKGDRQILYNTYLESWNKFQHYRANNRGTYFQRLIAFNIVRDIAEPINQLENIIKIWASGNHRRSAFQAAILDPKVDQRNTPYLGFPCLQQVAFLPHGHNGTEGLEVVGFYANQAILEKAYGNYLGLCYLGQFMAAQMNLKLIKMTCISSVLKLQNGNKPVSYFKNLENKLSNITIN
jgi:hypothetical protein